MPLQILSDDLATFSYRTLGKQKAPLIVRTRGHRLEGIWHSGSPLGGMISFFKRSIYSYTKKYDQRLQDFTILCWILNSLLVVIEPSKCL